MHQILLLDQNYLPINILSSRRVLGLLATEKVEAIDTTFNGLTVNINTVDGSLVLPSVIRLTHPVERVRHKARLSRMNIYLRDDYQCQIRFEGCLAPHRGTLHKSIRTVDHVRASSLGGPWAWYNVVAACSYCNAKKRNRFVGVMKAPYEPSWYSLLYKKILYKSNVKEWEKWVPTKA